MSTAHPVIEPDEERFYSRGTLRRVSVDEICMHSTGADKSSRSDTRREGEARHLIELVNMPSAIVCRMCHFHLPLFPQRERERLLLSAGDRLPFVCAAVRVEYFLIWAIVYRFATAGVEAEKWPTVTIDKWLTSNSTHQLNHNWHRHTSLLFGWFYSHWS